MRYRLQLDKALVGLLVALLWLTGTVRPVAATEGPHRAGLIVVHGDGRTIQQCVAFAEETVTGITLLERSGLDLNVDPSNAIGIAVCRIDNEGCSYPRQSCFCQCIGASCIYWSYWLLTADGRWTYSNLGASNRIVRDGDVDAWVWGAATNATAKQLPAVRFADICAPPTPTASATATATQPPPSATPAPTATSTPLPATDTPLPPTTMPSPTAVPTTTPTAPTGTPTAPTTSAPSGRTASPSAHSPTAATPTALRQPLTPIIATPTTPPAPVQQLASPTAAPARPAGADTPAVPADALARATVPTAVAAPELTAQRTPSATTRPAIAGPSPTPLLVARRQPTSTPTPAASSVAPPEASGALQALPFMLVGLMLLGVVLMRTRRRRTI